MIDYTSQKKQWMWLLINCVLIKGASAAFCEDSLQWRHNERAGISNHQPHDCYSIVYSRRRSRKTSKLRVTDLCAGNLPVTSEFPTQRASNAVNGSIWWRHYVAWLQRDTGTLQWPYRYYIDNKHKLGMANVYEFASWRMCVVYIPLWINNYQEPNSLTLLCVWPPAWQSDAQVEYNDIFYHYTMHPICICAFYVYHIILFSVFYVYILCLYLCILIKRVPHCYTHSFGFRYVGTVYTIGVKMALDCLCHQPLVIPKCKHSLRF